jgi:arsenate reductase (glutaredoxin)
MEITVYGIPTCGTVKKARAWLKAQGVETTWIDLREAPPSEAQIAEWIAAFGFKPMRNTSGGAYRALGDEKKTWGDKEWQSAFAADAMLLKRPIVLIDGAPALVGFKEPDYVERLG